MLKPARMQKVAVIGLKEEQQKAVSVLYDLGAVQIEPLSKESASLLTAGSDGKGAREISEELLRIRALKAALPPVPVNEKRRFASFSEALSVSRSITIDQEVSGLKERQERLTSQLEDLRGRIALVQNLQFVKEDLSIFDLESAVSFFGSVSAATHAALLQ
ncbi:MAG: V-type ATPase 116kDa subunit family protein, partial [Nitrososphaerales archaeon]